MNKAKIKKHFKELLKKEFYGKYKYITKPINYFDRDYVFLEKEIFAGVFYKGYELWFDCNENYVEIPRLGNYYKLMLPNRAKRMKIYDWWRCIMFEDGNYISIEKEEDIEKYFYSECVDKINNVLIPRGKRIKTLADCYELNKSNPFIDQIGQFQGHLLFAKLIAPKTGDHLESLLKEEILPKIALERYGEKDYYFKHEEFGPQLKALFDLNQEQELEEGRLLESDLVITTTNEEWPTVDPLFKEWIDPEVKKLIYI